MQNDVSVSFGSRVSFFMVESDFELPVLVLALLHTYFLLLENSTSSSTQQDQSRTLTQRNHRDRCDSDKECH